MTIAANALPLRRGSSGEAVRALQRALTTVGEPLLVVDGQYGPATESAVRGLQKHHGMPETGEANAELFRFLGLAITGTAAPARPDPFPPWMMGMWRLNGTKEIAGRVNNDAIMSYSRKIATRFPSLAWAVRIFTSDEVPHCGAGVAYSVAEVGIEPDPAYPSALAWANWGQALSGPAVGAVAVKKRPGAPNSGHVFFVAGRDGANIAGLGSNQGNMVKISPFKLSEIIAYRWPPDVPKPPPNKIGFRNLPPCGAHGPVGQSEA